MYLFEFEFSSFLGLCPGVALLDHLVALFLFFFVCLFFWFFLVVPHSMQDPSSLTLASHVGSMGFNQWNAREVLFFAF